MITLASHWEDYRRVYGPLPLSPTQEKELKQTFYAGFWSALGIMGEVSELPEDDAVKALQSLHAEAEIFMMPKGMG